MNLLKFVACFAVVTAMMLSSSAQAQSTPFNPNDVTLSFNNSFEDPIGAFTSNQWVPFSNGGASFAFTSTAAALFGSTHAVAAIDGDNNSFAGFFQQIDNITVGENYTFSLNARSAAPNLGGLNASFRIEWVDAAGAFVGGQFSNNVGLPVTDTYRSFSQSSIAPANASSLRGVFAVDSFGAGNVGFLLVDGTSIRGPAPSAVPEPTSLALLGLAVAGLVTRRRRS